MRVYKSPQVRMDGKRILYSFDKGVITATFDGVTDVFNLSGIKGPINTKGIKTTLAINPIERLDYVNGAVEVAITNYIGPDATETERFPFYQEV